MLLTIWKGVRYVLVLFRPRIHPTTPARFEQGAAACPRPGWLTGSRWGFLLAFAGGVAIMLGLFAPNIGPNGIRPSFWVEMHTNPPPDPSCHGLGCAMVGGLAKQVLGEAFTFWAGIATLILLLSGSQLLRRRLDDVPAGMAAFLLVLVSGGLLFACATCSTISVLGLLFSQDHATVSSGTPAVPLDTILVLWIGGLVLALVGGRRAGNAQD